MLFNNRHLGSLPAFVTGPKIGYVDISGAFILYIWERKHCMKPINVIGELVVEALKANHCQIDGMDKFDDQFKFRLIFNTRGGDVQQQVRLYPNKIQFEDLYEHDNNTYAGGYNTLPLEFMPIYNAILSIYVKETGGIPEVDFILY